MDEKEKLYRKILQYYERGESIERIKARFKMSYAEFMDVLIAVVEDENVKAVLESVKEICVGLRDDIEESKALSREIKQINSKLEILKTYKKIHSSEPTYVS